MEEGSVNQRVNFLIETLEGGNKLAFAKKVGSNSGTIGDLTGGRLNKPSFKMLKNIKEAYPKVNIEWIVTGQGVWNQQTTLANTSTNNDSIKGSDQIGFRNVPREVYVDKATKKNLTALVSQKARAGYLAGFADPEQTEELPTYDLPGLYDRTYRMFEVEGQSMVPTLRNKDIVVAEWVEHPDDMRDERIYVLVTWSEGIVVKRCLNRLKEYGYIIAKSDNITKLPKDNTREWENLHIYKKDIAEIWYARLYISPNFHAPSDLYNRLSNTEAELGHLMVQLKQKGIL